MRLPPEPLNGQANTWPDQWISSEWKEELHSLSEVVHLRQRLHLLPLASSGGFSGIACTDGHAHTIHYLQMNT
ncbi:hypothetical protein [Tengunoibacter tsumagoiensis]|uniref:hypothetical protein n=1 Tax=Tengunoibacter tsumagoiensis TaxID=2014871 RepID=UPI000F83B329|nr:hypothetical protein [Tengunoibacter tsumagoiensis]